MNIHAQKLSIILLIALFLTACSRADGENGRSPTPLPSPISNQPTAEIDNITLAVEGNLSRYQPLIEQFEQEQPDIRVRLVSVSEVANPDEESEIRALATSFDVFPYAPNRQEGSQYLLDLRPLLALDAQFDEADFLPGLLPDAPAPLWFVPIDAFYYITYYDKTAFAAAGLAYPQLEWTTDDFLAAAQALTMREDGEVTRWGYVPGQLRYAPLLVTQLTDPLDTGDGLRLTDPDVVAAVQWMSDLFTVHEVSPWLETYKPDDRHTGSDFQSPLALIGSGQAAMWHSAHVVYDASEENVGITAVPRSQYGYAADPILAGFAVSRGTRSPEAAWQLLHFLSRQPPQSSWITDPIPARRSVAIATNYWEQLPVDLAPVLQYVTENNAAPRISYQAANLLQEAFAAHIDDNIPVAVVLDQGETAVSAAPTPAATEVIVVQEAEPEIAEDGIRITFTSYSYLFEQHRLLANQFQNENPGIIVNVKSPDDTPGVNQYESLLAGNIDCFVESALALQDDELRAAILPLGPLLEVDGSLQIDDFYPLQRNYFIEEGELLAVPAFMWTPFIEYNRDLFIEAGLPEPPLDWTLDDFLEIAQQMSWGEGEAKQYGYAEPSVSLSYNGIVAFDVQYIDRSSSIPTFNYEAAAEMVAWYADLTRVYEVQPPLTGNFVVDFAQFETLLREERAAMWPGVLSDIVVIAGQNNTPLRFDIGFAPIPLGPSGSRGDLTGGANGYYIMADSPQREACWQWIKFLTLHPQAISLKLSLPAHIETVESAAYIDGVGEDLAAATRAFMDSSNPRADADDPSWFRPGRDWLREASREVASGESDVATALAKADVKFSQYRQCIIERNAFNDSNGQLECIFLVDPALGNRYSFRPGG